MVSLLCCCCSLTTATALLLLLLLCTILHSSLLLALVCSYYYLTTTTLLSYIYYSTMSLSHSFLARLNCSFLATLLCFGQPSSAPPLCYPHRLYFCHLSYPLCLGSSSYFFLHLFLSMFVKQQLLFFAKSPLSSPLLCFADDEIV